MTDFVVGITGGIGSGKSVVATMFAAHGIVEVDADAIARELTSCGGRALERIRDAFGDRAIAADGSLDRAAMRARVFADAQARERLEAILHPLIREIADARCAAAPSPYAVLVVPLMAETWASGDYRKRCRRILVVDCSEEVQLRRVMARNGLTEDAVRAILAVQAARPQRLAIADDVVRNDGTLDVLREQVGQLHQQYLMLVGRS